MALVGNISGSSQTNSAIGVTGSVIIANRPDAEFPGLPGSDTIFFVSGSTDGTENAVFGGDVVFSGSMAALADTVEITGSLGVLGPIILDGFVTIKNDLSVTGTLKDESGTTRLDLDTGIGTVNVYGSGGSGGNTLVEFTDGGTTILHDGSGGGAGTGNVRLTSIKDSADTNRITLSNPGDVTHYDSAGNTSMIVGTGGLSGSLTKLTDGTSYLVAGNNITIVSQSNGSVLISSTGAVPTPTGTSAYTQSFVYGDLTAGVLTVTHNLNKQYVSIAIYDDTGTLIIPDSITATSSTSLDIDLTSFGSFAGTWNLRAVAPDSSPAGYEQSFIDGDLVAGILSVSHGLNEQYVNVVVYNDSNVQVSPDSVTAVSTSAADVDLTSFGTLAGTWNLSVIPAKNSPYGYEQSFTNGDLSGGILTVNHGLGGQYLIVVVYDDTGEQVIPDDIVATSSTSADIDLTSFGSISGTWNISIILSNAVAAGFFISTVAGALYTSGSVAFVGPGAEYGVIQSPADKGSDVFFYVSGSINGSGVDDKKALFGGDVRISGSLSRGDSTTASGLYSHAEGFYTTASGVASHAEGSSTVASGDYSHAEGDTTTAAGTASHAEGSQTTASGDYSHAEGSQTTASGNYSHAEGESTKAGCLGYLSDSTSAGVIVLNASYGDVTAEFTPGNYVLMDDYVFGFIRGTSFVISSSTFNSPNTEVTLEDVSVTMGNSYIAVRGNLAPAGANVRMGNYSHAEGIYSIAQTIYAHAEGDNSLASGYAAHAEGKSTTASGTASHAEGYQTTASGDYSHAEGSYTIASGDYSHAEGSATTVASGNYSHAEGQSAKAFGDYSHAEGSHATAVGEASHAEGNGTTAYGNYSHAEGYFTIASGSYQHVGGKYNKRNNDFSLFVIGDGVGDADIDRNDVFRVNSGRVEVTGSFVSTLGLSGSLTQLSDGTSYLIAGTNITITSASNGSITIDSTASGGGDSYWDSLIADEIYTTGSIKVDGNAFITGTFATGTGSIASGQYSHAEGDLTTASGYGSHAEGYGTTASGSYSHAEGAGTTASGDISHAEGAGTTASGERSHAEGYGTTAGGFSCHAEGEGTKASGFGCHAEGYQTRAVGNYSHAEGSLSRASYVGCHAEGFEALAGARMFISPAGIDSNGIMLLDTSYLDVTSDFTTGSTLIIYEDSIRVARGGSYIVNGLNYDAVLSQTAITCSQYSADFGATNNTIFVAQFSEYSPNADQLFGSYSHAEGHMTTAIEDYSHAEGFGTTAIGEGSHAEGRNTIAAGNYSHAEGHQTVATGSYSHAEGRDTIASGDYSHAEGLGTISSGTYQHVGGKYNTRGNDFSLFVIGDGTGDEDVNRSDIVRINPGATLGFGQFQVTGSITVSGSYLLNVVSGTSNPTYNVGSWEHVVVFTTNNVTGVLPASAPVGAQIIFKEGTGLATVSGSQMLSSSAGRIDGSATFTMPSINYTSVAVIKIRTSPEQWIIV